jgi:hypothetical protein
MGLDMSSYMHVLDGRLRIKIPAVKNNFQKASEVVHALQQLGGVTYVRANPKTGSVLIYFESHVIGHEDIIQTLQDVDCLVLSSLASSPPSTLQDVGTKLTHLLVQSVVERAVQRMFLALI